MVRCSGGELLCHSVDGFQSVLKLCTSLVTFPTAAFVFPSLGKTGRLELAVVGYFSCLWGDCGATFLLMVDLV